MINHLNYEKKDHSFFHNNAYVLNNIKNKLKSIGDSLTKKIEKS